MQLNTLLIGAQKAGTTSLYDWLAQHPDIYAPPMAKDFCSFFLEDALYKRGYESYSALFKGSGGRKIIMAGDVNYLFFKQVAGRIHAVNPRMKFIVTLRNPVERAFSAYAYAVERGIENRSFEEAVGDELEGSRQYHSQREQAQKDYLAHGLYYRQLTHYLRFFSRDQIFIGLYEDILSDSEALLSDICRFLEIEPKFKADISPKNVTAGGSRFRFLNYVLYDDRFRNSLAGKALSALLSTSLKHSLTRILSGLNKKHGSKGMLSGEMRRVLTPYYQSDVRELQDLLKRDLSHWLSL